MPGTTLRLDDIDHKMLQILSLKTGKTQNTILLELLHDAFATHGISREETANMMADPNRFWTAQGKHAPVIPSDIHEQVLTDLAAIDDESDIDEKQTAA